MEYTLLAIAAFAVMVWRLAVVWTRGPRARKAFGEAAKAMQEGDWPAAETALRKVVKWQPIWAVGHRFLGRALVENGKEAEAEEHFRFAAALEPQNAAGYTDLGFFLALHAPGRDEDAINAFAKAVELAPRLRDDLARAEQLASLRAHEQFRRLLEPD